MSHSRQTTLLVCSGIAISCAIAFSIWRTIDSKDMTMKQPEQWAADTIRRESEIYIWEPDSKPSGAIFSERYEKLVSIREKICPVLVEILQDERDSGRLVKPIQGESDEHNIPIQRVCFLMRSCVPHEAIPLLIPFAQDVNPVVRQAVAFTIAESGSDDGMTSILDLLGDPVQDVVESACHGLSGLDRLSDRYRLELIKRLETLIQRSPASEQLCHLLSWMPHDEASASINRLLRDPDNESDTLITAVLGSPVLPDRDVLLTLITRRNDRPLDTDTAKALRYLLIMLGDHAHPDDEQLLFEFVDHDSQLVALGASEGLLRWHKLDGFFAWLHTDADIPSHIFNLREMLGVTDTVDKYGIVEAFWDLETDECRGAIKGFESIGAVECAAIINEALALTIAAEAKGDTVEESASNYSSDDNVENQWKSLDRRWKGMGQNLEIQLNLYIIENREQLRALISK
jgi:hypothetical protein